MAGPSKPPAARTLANRTDFTVLGESMGRDVRQSLQAGRTAGAVFMGGSKPLHVFRESIENAITDIEERGTLLRRFLTKGPYEGRGHIPRELKQERLSDAETARAITFIYSHMVNCFQGRLAEMLAIRPVLGILSKLKRQHRVPETTQLYVGDAALPQRLRGPGRAKGADFHWLDSGSDDSGVTLRVVGVGEVKSYLISRSRLLAQLERHMQRAQTGLLLMGHHYGPRQIQPWKRAAETPSRIGVIPAGWKLPRTFTFETREGVTTLVTDSAFPTGGRDRIENTEPGEWRVVLRWSKEALAEAAYGLTFWYMEKLGEAVFAEDRPWSEMSPGDAGRNAAKMMLYYAISRCRTYREQQRAIALYNTYCFGYSLGMNFKNQDGRREMLWFEDLKEIADRGCTDKGCRIWR